MAASTTASAPSPPSQAPTGRTDLEWGVARGIAMFRILAWGWSAAVLGVTRADLSRAPAAVALSAGALAITVVGFEGSLRRRRWLFHPATVAGEVLFGACLLVADGWVYGEFHGQTFGSAWPVAGVLMAGVVAGASGGVAAGIVLGIGRFTGSGIAPFAATSNLGLWSSGVLYAMAGGAGGAVMTSIRRAETAVARARAREEVARTLHDGVLQILAVVQRRSTDGELVALARDQEIDLRAFLAGDRPTTDDLGAALRSAAAHVERRDGLRVEVLLVDEDHPPVHERVVGAIAGAVGEALTNAAKHGGATRATVFVDVDDAVFCSVKDDGAGFDPATVSEGLGSTTSIRGRMAEVGGTTEIDARPGHGVEVRLRAPLRPARST